MSEFKIKDFNGEKVEFSSNKDWTKEFKKKSYEDLVKENKEMLEMLQYLNRRGGLGLDIHNKIKQLIKQATEI